MKNKIALFIASLIVGIGFGVVFYIFNFIQSIQEFLIYSLGFGVSMFLFELYTRPLINKLFKKQKL